MGVDESRMTVNQIDIVPPQRIADVLHLELHHASDLIDELRHRRADRRTIDTGVTSVERRRRIQPSHRLAKGFGGNSAGFDANAADTALLLDQDNPFTQLRRLNRSTLSGRATADTNQVAVIAFRHHSSPLPLNSLLMRFNLSSPKFPVAILHPNRFANCTPCPVFCARIVELNSSHFDAQIVPLESSDYS